MKPFRPQLERLDDRVVPSVSASVVGRTLVINGDDNSNVITVVDTGNELARDVYGRIDGISLNRLASRVLRFTPIDGIQIFGRGGNDTVTYSLPFGFGAVRGPAVNRPGIVRNLYVDLGSGDDTYTADLGTFIDFGSRLNQTVTGYGGNDTITSAFNGRLGGIIDSNFDGGTGNNLIRYDFAEDNRSAGAVNTYVNNHGNDAVVFNLFEESSSGTLHNFQLNANDNDVTLYSAVVHRPHLTTSFLNADNLTVVVVAKADTGRGPFLP